MATTPQRPAPPPPPPARPAPPAQPAHGTAAPPHQAPPPAAAAPAQPIGDQQAKKAELDKATAGKEPPPPPVRTIADEQRERSDEIAKMGVEAYKRSIDQRKDEDKPKPVPGVGPLQVEERPRVEAHRA
jgi:hypothetical protein